MDSNIKDNNNLIVVSNEEKQQLKKRIFHSIGKIKRRRRLQYLSGAAASITILLFIGVFSHKQSQNTSITNFVNSSEKVNFSNSENVTITLNEGEDINLEGEDASITYSKTGAHVNVGGSNTYTQNTEKNGKVTYNTLLVPYGKRSMITLSDGSKVWLNSGSRLVYPVVFNTNKREVYLEGEAIFDVTHDASHPFVVLSENQEIEVLGTVFNVSSYADDDDNFVVLKSGSVQVAYKKELVSNKSSQKMVITPGTMANINLESNHVSSKQVNVNQYFSWKDGVLILKNNNLSYIMRRLSRYYNIPITIEDEALAKETFSGYLDLKDNAEKVIQTIKQTSNLDYQKTETNKFIITKK
ncbi:FecR family protein [Mariniflexile sp.]|uniref:FecR family protein n=2 Tax=Mariniflexile sp. TaxID=1979402 RepID=UPI004047AE73